MVKLKGVFFSQPFGIVYGSPECLVVVSAGCETRCSQKAWRGHFWPENLAPKTVTTQALECGARTWETIFHIFRIFTRWNQRQRCYNQKRPKVAPGSKRPSPSPEWRTLIVRQVLKHLLGAIQAWNLLLLNTALTSWPKEMTRESEAKEGCKQPSCSELNCAARALQKTAGLRLLWSAPIVDVEMNESLHDMLQKHLKRYRELHLAITFAHDRFCDP